MTAMTTLSHRIREAALGPTPMPSTLRMDWIGLQCLRAVHERIGDWSGDVHRFQTMTVTERRMALLFVAEALEGEA